jgi:hypothetical protein
MLTGAPTFVMSSMGFLGVGRSLMCLTCNFS